MINKKEIVNNFCWSFLVNAARAVVQVLKVSVLARFLDKSDFGLVAIVLTVTGFTQIFTDMGISISLFHKSIITEKQKSSLYWINIIIAVIIFTLIVFLSGSIANYYNDHLIKKLIILSSITILFYSIGKQPKTYLEKELNFKFLGIVEISGLLINFTVALILALKGYGVYSLIYSLLVGSAFTNILFLINSLRSNKLIFYISLKEVFPFLKVGTYYVGTEILANASRKIDVFIVGKLLGMEALGVYDLAKNLVLKVYGLLFPFMRRVIIPYMAKLNDNTDKIKYYYLKMNNIISSVNILPYVLIIIISYPLVTILYGENYIEVAYIQQIIALGAIFDTVSQSASTIMVAKGRTNLGFKWTIITFFITPILVYIASLYSIIHVAYSFVIGNILLFIPHWDFVIKELTSATLKEFLNTFIVPFIVSGILIIIYFTLIHDIIININVWYSLIIFTIITPIIYIGLNILFGNNIILIFRKKE